MNADRSRIDLAPMEKVGKEFKDLQLYIVFRTRGERFGVIEARFIDNKTTAS